MADLIPIPTISADNLADIRSAPLIAGIELSDRVIREDHVVSEDPHVIVRVHTPVGDARPRPCLYSIHGGGYVLGSMDMDDAKFDKWCPELDMVGISVEYRLAPETP